MFITYLGNLLWVNVGASVGVSMASSISWGRFSRNTWRLLIRKTLLLFQHGILKCKLIQGLVQVSVGLGQVHQSRPKPEVLLPKCSSDVAGGLTAPTTRKIAILVPCNVVEVVVAIDH